MLRQRACFIGASGLLVACLNGGEPQRPEPRPGIARETATAFPDAAAPWPGVPPDIAALPPANTEASPLEPYDPPPAAPAFSRVVRADRPLPPISGGTLAVSGNGKLLASDPDRDLIQLVDLATQRVTTIALAQGDEPGRIATAGELAYVALRAGGALLTVDLNRQELSARTPVCAAPRGVFNDESSGRVLVACAGGAVVAVSSDGKRVLSKSHVAPDLRDIGRDAQGVWVSQFRSATLLRLDAELRIRARHIGPSIAAIGSSDFGAAPAPNSFSPSLAFRTISTSDGEAFMLHQRAQSTSVAPLPQGYGGSDGLFCEGGILHTTITRFGASEPLPQAALPQAAGAVDVAMPPDGRLLAAIVPGNFLRQDQPFQPDGFGGMTAIGPAQQLFLVAQNQLARAAGSEPFQNRASDCLIDAGRWEHRFPGEAVALQFADDRTLLVQVREPAELHVFQLDASDAPRLSAVIALSPLSVRDTGHEVFHQNTAAGIACAACHGEGLDDGHVWTFSDVGARRTQHLRGGFSQSAPFHWSGELATFDALIDDVFQQRMSGSVLGAEARTALAGFLDALPLVTAEAADAAAAARGRTLFESQAVECSRCHAGSALRVAGRYDVGTGGSFEVPSLHGLSLRLPLLHTGCAATLEERFDPSCGGGDQHGKTSQLSVGELADLVAYLASL